MKEFHTILNSMVGKTIETVVVRETYNDDCAGFTLCFTDGSEIEIGRNAYNDGSSEVTVELIRA